MLNYILFILKSIFFIGFLNLNIDWLKFLPLLLPLLLSVAFFTLMERKIMASMQRRRGPNVVGIFGFLQAIADAFKLLAKETVIPSTSNFLIFLLAPIITFIISYVG